MPAEIITGGASVVPWSLVQASVRRFKCPNKASTQRRTRSPSRRPHFRGVSGGRAAGTRCAPERPPLIAGMLFVSVGLGKTRSAFWLRLIRTKFQMCFSQVCTRLNSLTMTDQMRPRTARSDLARNSLFYVCVGVGFYSLPPV